MLLLKWLVSQLVENAKREPCQPDRHTGRVQAGTHGSGQSCVDQPLWTGPGWKVVTIAWRGEIVALGPSVEVLTNEADILTIG